MDNPQAEHVIQYQALFDSLSEQQRYQLAHIKRFLERVCGDDEFRESLGQVDHHSTWKELAREIGCEIDPYEIMPLWHHHYMLQKGTDDANDQFPLHKLWIDYIHDLKAHLGAVKYAGGPREMYPALHTWRIRQMLRVNSQLGQKVGQAIVHPLVAFELSDGCSVGCWFCGISADKFKGFWSYSDENAALWQAIQQRCHSLFGTSMQTGFCYWATDPIDNPDYANFLKDYYQAHNYMPQTTTAAPLKNLALTKEIMGLYADHRHITNRFSILNRKLLRRVHETFSAEELMGVELVLHNKESAQLTKSRAGKAQQKLKEGQSRFVEEIIDTEGTIACVSGFLVNMPNRSVMMVSPVPACDEWPKGYRIFGEQRFNDADEFEAAIHSLVLENCSNRLPAEQPLQLRHDLHLEKDTEGEKTVYLSARNTRVFHNFTTTDAQLSSIYQDLLAMIEQGIFTPGKITRTLSQQGHNVFVVATVIDNLFRMGLIEEDSEFLSQPADVLIATDGG